MNPVVQVVPPAEEAARILTAAWKDTGRLAARPGIDTHLHCLHHYSATELIATGVVIRTVAGRLGHAGGGSTALRCAR